MKRLFLIFAVVVIAFSACGQNRSNVNNGDETTDQKETNVNQEQQMKTLVAYFSATGTTKTIAERLANVSGADLYEIKPEVPYTDADLDWRNKNSRSTIEMQDKNSRPAIVKDLNNVENYSTIYIGFPVWWYTAPTIINTFIESYDFSGKTVIFFATSGGSTIDKANVDFAAKYPNLNWKAGKVLNGATEEVLKEWVEEL